MEESNGLFRLRLGQPLLRKVGFHLDSYFFLADRMGKLQRLGVQIKSVGLAAVEFVAFDRAV